MSERSKETVLKTVEGNLREFESRPVRLSGSEFSRDPLFYMRFRAVCCMRFLQTLSCGLLQAFTGFYARCRVCVAARSALYVGVVCRRADKRTFAGVRPMRERASECGSLHGNAY